jgi:tetratricopeptide (TPR) repeat protein
VPYVNSSIAVLLLGISSVAHAESRTPTAAECNNRGVDFCAQDQYSKAIREFNKALRLDPNYVLAYRNRAVTFLRLAVLLQGRSRPFLQQALFDYTTVLMLDPKDADAYRERGLVHARMGDADRAIADFTQALKIRPNFANAYRARSKAYRDKGDIDRALADLDQAIKAEAAQHSLHLP